jgi:F0F1-type ATP synthase epsilon subunit
VRISAKLSLEIVTTAGITLKKSDVDYVVVRLKEKNTELGSELAIWPRHAPLLARIDFSRLKYERQGEKHDLDIKEGVLQVKDNQVTIVIFSDA